jgi:hypothetical protein
MMTGIKCKELTYTVVNPLTIRITGGTNSITPVRNVEDDIIELTTEDGISYKTGLTLVHKKRPYKINIIEQGITRKIIYYDLKIAERTKSSIFILPMLGTHKTLFLYDSLLLNAFIGIHETGDCIVLVYRFSMDPIFMKFEQALKQFSNFKETIDIDPHHVVFVFAVPKRHQVNYQKFVEGEYSKMSNDYKIQILDFHDLDLGGPIGQILFKNPKRKLQLEELLDVELEDDSELYSIMTPETEHFDPNYYFGEPLNINLL